MKQKQKLKAPISVEIDLSLAIQGLNDKERAEWVEALLETISEEGTIQVLRDLVAQTQWDDQK